MDTTSVRLPESMYDGIDQMDTPISEIVRPSIADYLVDRMVGRCAVSGEILYTHSDFWAVSSGTPISNAIGIENHYIEGFVLADSIATDISKQIQAGDLSEVDIEPEYYNRTGAPIYAAEEAFLQSAHSDQREMYSWAYDLLDSKVDQDGDYRRVLCLLSWLDSGGDDLDGVSLQDVWDATPGSVKERIRDVQIDVISDGVVDVEEMLAKVE